MKPDKKSLLIEMLMAAFVSGSGLLISPMMMRIAAGQKENVMLMTVGTAACFSGVLILTVFLFDRKRGERGTGPTGRRCWSAVKRTVLVYGILLTGMVLVSMLSGIGAVLFYDMLKTTLETEQIKGIINYTTAVLTVLLLPVFLSLFWTAAREERVQEAFSGLRHRYIKLLILCVLVFGSGILVRTICNNITGMSGAQAAGMILLTACGFAALVISEQICSEERGGREK